MNQASPTTQGDSKSKARKRNLILAAALIPLAAFFAILAWGVARSENSIGRPGINSAFGDTVLQLRPAPSFQGTTLDGRTISLDDLKGTVVVIDFWSSWCPPCRREAPGLAQVYDEFRGKGVEFLGVAIWDQEDNVRDFVDELGVPYPNIMDDKGAIAIDYGVIKLPEKFFVDRDGNLARKFSGPTEPDDLRDALSSLVLP